MKKLFTLLLLSIMTFCFSQYKETTQIYKYQKEMSLSKVTRTIQAPSEVVYFYKGNPQIKITSGSHVYLFDITSDPERSYTSDNKEYYTFHVYERKYNLNFTMSVFTKEVSSLGLLVYMGNEEAVVFTNVGY